MDAVKIRQTTSQSRDEVDEGLQYCADQVAQYIPSKYKPLPLDSSSDVTSSAPSFTESITNSKRNAVTCLRILILRATSSHITQITSAFSMLHAAIMKWKSKHPHDNIDNQWWVMSFGERIVDFIEYIAKTKEERKSQNARENEKTSKMESMIKSSSKGEKGPFHFSYFGSFPSRIDFSPAQFCEAIQPDSPTSHFSILLKIYRSSCLSHYNHARIHKESSGANFKRYSDRLTKIGRCQQTIKFICNLAIEKKKFGSRLLSIPPFLLSLPPADIKRICFHLPKKSKDRSPAEVPVLDREQVRKEFSNLNSQPNVDIADHILQMLRKDTSTQGYESMLAPVPRFYLSQQRIDESIVLYKRIVHDHYKTIDINALFQPRTAQDKLYSIDPTGEDFDLSQRIFKLSNSPHFLDRYHAILLIRKLHCELTPETAINLQRLEMFKRRWLKVYCSEGFLYSKAQQTQCLRERGSISSHVPFSSLSSNDSITSLQASPFPPFALPAKKPLLCHTLHACTMLRSFFYSACESIDGVDIRFVEASEKREREKKHSDRRWSVIGEGEETGSSLFSGSNLFRSFERMANQEISEDDEEEAEEEKEREMRHKLKEKEIHRQNDLKALRQLTFGLKGDDDVRDGVVKMMKWSSGGVEAAEAEV
ncbi:hypothetical protein ADUPG1_010041, partial [Aduncisulcus paluster]